MCVPTLGQTSTPKTRALILIFGAWCGWSLLFGATRCVVECGATEIQPDDIIAAYEYNLSMLPRMRVVYEYVVERSDVFYQLNPGATSESADPVLEDYWTDRKRFLLRMPKSFSEGQSYVPSDTVITPDVLLSVYRDTFVFSYGSTSANGFRWWSGVEKDGQGGGVTGVGSVADRIGLFLFPPLGATDPTWGPEGIRHAIDVFFADGTESLSVVGTIRVDNVETVVAQRTVYAAAPAVQQREVKGKLEIAQVTTAWIDMQRGCLPVRMDQTNCFVLDGNPLGRTDTQKALDPAKRPETDFAVVVSRIERSDGGAFYPSGGYTVQRCVSPEYKGPFNDMQGVIQGKTIAIPMVDLQRMTWRTHSIRPDVAMDEETLALAFPPGTRYVDTSRNRGMVEGMAEEALDRLLEQERGVPPSFATGSHLLKSVLALANLLLIGILVYVFWLRRRKR